mmetsp:Transcript_30682/g.80191  ORF Transcript_30682/g.80191 Transcript_30682/m.80191 type:complete len:178 (+) Transcript_30682:2213-2746(+)
MGLVPTSARLHCLSLSTIKRTIPLSYTHAPTSMQAWTHTDATDYTQRKQGGRLHQLLSKVVGIVDHIYYLLLHTFPLALYPICSGPAHIYLIGASAGRTLAANVGLALLEPLFIPLLKRLKGEGGGDKRESERILEASSAQKNGYSTAGHSKAQSSVHKHVYHTATNFSLPSKTYPC